MPLACSYPRIAPIYIYIYIYISPMVVRERFAHEDRYRVSGPLTAMNHSLQEGTTASSVPQGEVANFRKQRPTVRWYQPG